MYQRRKGKERTRNRKRRKNSRKRRLSKKRQNQIRKPGSRWLFLAGSTQKKNTDEILLHVRGHPRYWDKKSLDKRVNKGLPFTVIYWLVCPLFSFLVFLPFTNTSFLLDWSGYARITKPRCSGNELKICSTYFKVIVMGREGGDSNRQRVFIREGRLIHTHHRGRGVYWKTGVYLRADVN